MARTKHQARAARSESTQRLTSVNEGWGSRVRATTADTENDGEVSSASGSERDRRAAKRKDAVHLDPMQRRTAASGQFATEITKGEGEEDDSDDCHMTPAAGVESENYYTALGREATEAETGDSVS